MDSALIAALISGGIAILGVFASLIIARWQVNIQKKELELKAKEIDTTAKKIRSELDALQQTQFTEILKKRLDVYPKIWEIVIKYTLHWKSENKARDHQWAKDFLEQLTTFGAESGVFFSQAVYVRYSDLENVLIRIEKKMATGKNVDEFELYIPDKIFIGENHEGGLATFLKDDLGSYRDVAIQARGYIPESFGQNFINNYYQPNKLSERTLDSTNDTNDTSDISRDSFSVIGKLIVVNSDDVSLINKHFDINKKITTLGRKADNDIVFSKDSSVSRQHALIKEIMDGLFISEVKDSESSNYPTYGTFVNDKKLGNQAILLKDGDVIRLGKRVVLKYVDRKT